MPLRPQPIKPKRTAGFVPEAKTAAGLKIVTTENEATPFMKFLLAMFKFIVFYIVVFIASFFG